MRDVGAHYAAATPRAAPALVREGVHECVVVRNPHLVRRTTRMNRDRYALVEQRCCDGEPPRDRDLATPVEIVTEAEHNLGQVPRVLGFGRRRFRRCAGGRWSGVLPVARARKSCTFSCVVAFVARINWTL